MMRISKKKGEKQSQHFSTRSREKKSSHRRRSGHGARSLHRGGQVGTHYRLCWAHDPSELSDYKFEVDAHAELVGPLAQDIVCTLGLQCNFTLNGSSLAATNKVLVLDYGECGDENVTLTNWTGTLNPQQESGNPTSSSPAHALRPNFSGFYDFGKPIVGVPGIFYRLCWGHDPQSLSEFRF